MKKLFLLIPALILSLGINATTHEIGSGTSNILGSTVASAADGDVIILTDNGPYVNHYDADEKLRDDYTRLEKNLTIKAGEGVHPVVKYEVPFRSRYGKSVKFIDITFDGSSLSEYEFYFRCQSNDNNNLEFEDCEFKNCSKYFFQIYTAHKAGTLTFKNCRFHDNTNRGILNQGTIDNLNIDGCEFSNFTGNAVIDNYSNATIGKIKINGTEFYGNSQYMINGTATSHADSCIITNCYVHNNSKSFVYFRKSTVENVETCDGIVIANTTFENNDFSSISYSLIDINYVATPSTDATQVLVDHCTFYNCPVTNSDYAAVKIVATHPLISNSIFALPATDVKNGRAIHMQDGQEVRNCLTYNYVKDSNWGIRSGVTKTNCIKETDPLFTDVANGDYSYAGEYGVSMSPARGAGTDGSDLGDPRWYTPVTYPSTDFASGYTFTASKATLSGSIIYETDGPDDPYLRYNAPTTPGYATWVIQATRACHVNVTVNMADNSWNKASDANYKNGNHIFGVELWDKSTNTRKDTVAEGIYGDGTLDGYSTYPTVNLGSIEIPAAGLYTVKLLNPRGWAKCGVESVTFAYQGGAVQDMPGTTDIDDAWFSPNGTRADGKIDFPNNDIQNGWVKWNVSFANTASYKVKVKVNTNSGHNYTVKLYRDANDADPITFANGAQYSQKGSPVELEINAQVVEAGSYIMEVVNSMQHSDAELISVEFIYAGGAVVDIPNNNLPLTEAILEGGATRDNDGLHFRNSQYVEWNIHAAAEGLFTFSATCTSNTNYSNLTIKVKQGANELYSYTPQYEYMTTDKVISSPQWVLDAGDYVLELSNPTSGNGYVTSLAATAAEGVFILNDNKTDDGSIAAADFGTTSTRFDVYLKRSFTAGKYYTICVPFDSYNSQLSGAFGSGYEVWKMASAEQDGDVINLNFEQINGDNFAAGTPYIIKPTIDVENPTFSQKKILNNSTTRSFTAADFVGTFYKDEIPAGENNLYLQNNNLYYSESSNTTIKGTRAWIRLKQQQGSAPARARIVMGGQVATDINLVNGELVNGTVKVIENGQLILIRDGKKYNVMGTRLQ